MGKRNRASMQDSDSWSLDDNSDLPAVDTDADDYEDAPSTKKIKRKAPSIRKTAKTRENDASVPSSGATDSSRRVVHHVHASSLHVVQHPSGMRAALLKWYKSVHDARGMPWRKVYNPHLNTEERAQRAYEVWISEIMLQQTQVVTVIPYYNRWMQRFPTIRDLASANIEEVNGLWKGLGYYSRASRLLQGAQKAVKQYGGKLPSNAKDMEANIPGIGRYSAGAICSIAYGEQVPVLDGNVHRLLSRVLALHANPKAKSTLDILWAGAKAMVEIRDTSPSGASSDQYAGDINQALIELGSTVCKVRDPDCGSCPLRRWCNAFKQTETTNTEEPVVVEIEEICSLCDPVENSEGVTAFPMKANRKKAREELDIVNVIEWRSKEDPEDRHFLLVRRPEGGLLAGLYEFPSAVNVPNDISCTAQEDASRKVVTNHLVNAPSLTSKHGGALASDEDPSPFEISKVVPVGDVLHVFSHIRKTYRVQWVVLEGGATPPKLREAPFDIEPRPTKKRKKSGQAADTDLAGNEPKNVVWAPLQDVTKTNMGTGVVKVWNLVKKKWGLDGTH